MTFKLDTSGHVETPPAHFVRTAEAIWYWSHLSPFTQGYIEALFSSEQYGLFSPGNHGEPPAFSDLAPETLARIIADCEAARRRLDSDDAEDAGAVFWRLRQEGHYVGGLINFPPLTVQLGDDGKVRFQDTPQ